MKIVDTAITGCCCRDEDTADGWGGGKKNEPEWRGVVKEKRGWSRETERAFQVAVSKVRLALALNAFPQTLHGLFLLTLQI